MSVHDVNVASRLAMLAERIAKLHAQIGRDVLVTRSHRALRDAAGEFEQRLRAVAVAATGAELRDNYKLLRLLWDEYRPAAQQTGGAQAARKVAERAEEVAWVAEKGARMLHELSHSPIADLVIGAGRARAAAQRLGKLYVLRGWALPADAAPREVKRAQAEILLAFAQLRGAVETDDDIAGSLQMAESQFIFLKQAAERLEQGRERALQLDHIAKSADHLAEAMDHAASLYEKKG